MAENILGKQVAGLPVGAWAAVVAGGLGLAYVINRGQSDDERQPLVEPGVGTGLVPAGSISQPSQNGNQQSGPENNLQWGNQAKNWLISQGHDPTTADNAVRKYLSAEDLTLQENALIGLVLSASGLGAPPEDLPPVNVPEQPPGGEEPEIPRDPQLQLQFVGSVPYGGKLEFNGRVAFGATGTRPDSSGTPPGSPQLIRIDVHHSAQPQTIVSTYFTLTDSNGNFTTRPGWTSPTANKSGRRYTFHWVGYGARKSDWVRFN